MARGLSMSDTADQIEEARRRADRRTGDNSGYAGTDRRSGERRGKAGTRQSCATEGSTTSHFVTDKGTQAT